MPSTIEVDTEEWGALLELERLYISAFNREHDRMGGHGPTVYPPILAKLQAIRDRRASRLATECTNPDCPKHGTEGHR